ncbi:hypothetical protein SESBI_43075 [Sesbania bispinosa]|nr:hypothetical protein SESBI_43075 [Sesbania bispinosa]
MASERTNLNEDTKKPLCACEDSKAEPGRSRGRKTNVKGPKKAPQRGLGVEKLERLRIQESWKKMAEASGVPTLHDPHLLQCHPPMFGSGSVPMRYGAPSPNHAHGGFQCPHQQVMMNGNTVPFIGNKGGMNVLGGGGSNVAAGWLMPNQVNRVGPYGSGPSLLGPLVGTPLETSKELSSMPNVHYSQPECLDLCLKKTRLNEDNVKGSNARRDRPIVVHDFMGYMPHSAAPNLVGETGDFYNKLARHDANAIPDECAEVVAVHRRGNSVSGSGRVFMEYEFFPGKDGRGTTSKELKLLTKLGSAAVGHEASSSTAYGDTASNSIDLSLKLSR